LLKNDPVFFRQAYFTPIHISRMKINEFQPHMIIITRGITTCTYLPSIYTCIEWSVLLATLFFNSIFVYYVSTCLQLNAYYFFFITAIFNDSIFLISYYLKKDIFLKISMRDTSDNTEYYTIIYLLRLTPLLIVLIQHVL